MRRLASHPAVAAALAAEAITTSRARAICAWTDRLPDGLIQDAMACRQIAVKPIPTGMRS